MYSIFWLDIRYVECSSLGTVLAMFWAKELIVRVPLVLFVGSFYEAIHMNLTGRSGKRIVIGEGTYLRYPGAQQAKYCDFSKAHKSGVFHCIFFQSLPKQVGQI
jgi:hypothetical protein